MAINQLVCWLVLAVNWVVFEHLIDLVLWMVCVFGWASDESKIKWVICV